MQRAKDPGWREQLQRARSGGRTGYWRWEGAGGGGQGEGRVVLRSRVSQALEAGV